MVVTISGCLKQKKGIKIISDWKLLNGVKMLQIGVNFKSVNNTGFITNDKALKQIL